MTGSLFLIFNHTFTGAQREDALISLGVSRIIDMPPDYKAVWRSILPDIEHINDYLKPVQIWLKCNAVQKDFVLIQGDFGACYIMVNYALKLGLVPVYSTTGREAKESVLKDGTVKVTHHFKHIIFRRYER